jgi:hypothetical protein
MAAESQLGDIEQFCRATVCSAGEVEWPVTLDVAGRRQLFWIVQVERHRTDVPQMVREDSYVAA